jgi:hypothetical protein
MLATEEMMRRPRRMATWPLIGDETNVHVGDEKGCEEETCHHLIALSAAGHDEAMDSLQISDYLLGTPIDNAVQPTLEIGVGFY